MRDASAAFQPDRAGSPGFQLAEDGGFQTQPPAELGALELHLILDGITSRYSPSNRTVGELALVLELNATTRGPRQEFTAGVSPYTYPLKRRVLGALELVLSLEGVTRFRARPPQPRRMAAPAIALEHVLQLEARVRHLDYVREVLEPEDEELLLLL